MVADHSVAALPRTALVVRPRLIERLRRRFDARLTLLTGGGGSGKTTVLAQALDAETDGLDVWYPCTSRDRDPKRLLAGLLRAVEAALDTDSTPGESDVAAVIAGHALNASPRAVCLVVDDVHLLGTGEAIETLLEVLPANAHVLLSGRHLPPLNTARLDAAGRLAEIGQHELLMTPEEQIEFANARGIDVARLAGAEGWPAFVELASAGTQARSRRYLEEEAVTALSPERRAQLAAFSHVGGGDDEIAHAVTGIALDELVEGLPLVRWSGDAAQLHDLWGELLVDELDRTKREAAALAASAVHRSHRRIDEAIDLAVSVGSGSDIVASISAAVRHGIDGGIHRDRLESWSALLQVFAEDAPIAALVDGLIARELDSTSTAVWELLDDAARRFDDAAEPELELVALAQLGYVARCLHDPERIDSVMARIERLAQRHAAARPFLAFGDAWKALTTARPDLQLAAMERIADAPLPAMWQITRDHLRAHALFSLGRANEASGCVPKNMADLPVPIPGSLTTEAQCHWYAGRPEVAAALSAPADPERHGLRDQYMTTAWAAAVAAYTGQAAHAARLAGRLTDLAGERLGAVDVIFGPGVAAAVDIAEGDEAAAAAKFRRMIELSPLGNGPVEQVLRGNLALPHVLVPESREFWRSFGATGTQRTAIELADCFVESRERGTDRALAVLDWPEPGVVASVLPARWAVEFALRGVRAGRHEGRVLASWLCEHWGAPARELLRAFAEDHEFGDVAADVIATTPLPPAHRVCIRVLGRTDLLIDGHESSEPNWRRERVRALLTWLLLNPETTRQQAAGALWPDLSIDRAAKNLRTTLNYLHGLLEPRRSSRDATWFVRVSGQHVRLHHDLDVDLWQYRRLLEDADRAERQGRASDALAALTAAVSLWRGDLAEDLDHEWLELERIHLRSRFVRASCRAAELLTATNRPNDAIELLRPALAADPWHERSYSALAAAYDAVGDRTSARAIAERAAELLDR